MGEPFKPQLDQAGGIVAQKEVKVLPGVRGRAARNIIVGDEVIPAGSDIIIQPLDQKAGTYKITTYERKDLFGGSDLPEAQNDIVPIQSYQVSGINPSKNFIFDQHYKITKQPLFSPGSPKLADIIQGTIPNCFALAAIQGILSQKNGDLVIKSMMRQNDDGTVTVRLYDPENLEPVYMRVQTAKLVDQHGEALSRHSELWVHVLENAYAAFGKRKAKNGFIAETVDSSAGSVFSGGGQIDFALTVFAGIDNQKTHNLAIQNNLRGVRSELYHISEDELMMLGALNALPPERQGELLKSVLMANFDAAQSLSSYQENEEGLTADLVAYAKFYQQNQEACSAITSSDILNRQEKMAALQKLAKEQGVQGGLNFITNIQKDSPYEQKTMEVYQAIESALKNNQIVTAGTGHKDSIHLEGIVGPHAYTVLGVRQDEKGNRFVQLRNPWGDGGLEYINNNGDPAAPKTKSSNNPIFEMELNDFYQNFYNVHVSKDCQSAFSFDIQRAELLTEVNYLVENHAVSSHSTLMELCEFQADYKQYESGLLKIEQKNLDYMKANRAYHVEQIGKVFADSSKNDGEKQTAVIKLVQEARIKRFNMPGTEEQKQEQLYRLLKLNWLESQEKPDNKAIEDVKATIVKHAGYDFCEVMNNKKLVADTVAYGFAKNFPEQVKVCEQLAKKVQQTQQEIMPSLEAMQPVNLDKATTLINAAAMLKTEYMKAVNEKAFLKNLNIGEINTEQLDALKSTITQCDEFVNTHDELLKVKDKIEAAREETYKSVVSAVGNKQLSERDAAHVNECIDSNDPRKQAEMAKHVPASVGEKLSALARLVECFKSLVQSLRNLINKNQGYNVVEKVEGRSFKDRYRDRVGQSQKPKPEPDLDDNLTAADTASVSSPEL
ncbi:C2 family cysteine protease [Legionella dresdenensis]|uniref:C2 family cysteine protease n=1 Tax=Legionella dresdenensis TaxID=450200 RepID=A0ABV8CHJ7_9GAMM